MKNMIVLVLAVILYSCSTTKPIKNQVDWEDDIYNPDNKEFVIETAFNLGKPVKKVTQQDFNRRYQVIPRDYQIDIVDDTTYVYDGSRFVGKCTANTYQELIEKDNL